MKTNKMLPDKSIDKIWDKFRKMNGIILELPLNGWLAQGDAYVNTVEYEGFTSDEILEIDLYDDGNLTEEQITQYDSYITEFNVEDGKIIAVATTQPTQTIKILARGEIVGKMIVGGGSSDISASNVSCLDKDGQTSNVQKELDEQNKKFGIELLWSNSKQTSEFSAQTVNIDTSKHSRFLVLASYYTASEYTVNELLNVKGITQTITTNATALNKRTATVNDNGIAFGKGVFLTNNSWADSNGNAVPKFVYGVY